LAVIIALRGEVPGPPDFRTPIWKEIYLLLQVYIKDMGYSITLISVEAKEELVKRYASRIKYELKSEIYGCCIKLLTDSMIVRDRWSDNLYSMSQNIRSHGRLYVFDDPEEENDQVYYDPTTKTGFLLNIQYYGWIKSLALSVAGDILEDEHEIYSIHGACLDTGCEGLCILGGSGTGKTTHTYGLLRNEKVRVIADDWFFSRVYGPTVLGYGSEKNFYIRADLATIWPEFHDLVDRAEFDKEGRAVVDLRWVVGKGRILPLTTLRTVIILTRAAGISSTCEEIDPGTALVHLETNGYYNPHFLVQDSHKARIRKEFFHNLLARTRVFEVNTAGTPEETQRLIQKISNQTGF
jgi:hypothetical protein